MAGYKKFLDCVFRFALPGFLVVVTIGCGSGNRAHVAGTVVHNGQPVTGGSLTFAPVNASATEDARPASGKVKEDGSFELGTDEPGDGAAIGQHNVIYTPPSVDWDAPEWDGRGTPPKPPATPYDGLVVKESTVGVQSGKNELTIELAPATQAGRP